VKDLYRSLPRCWLIDCLGPYTHPHTHTHTHTQTHFCNVLQPFFEIDVCGFSDFLSAQLLCMKCETTVLLAHKNNICLRSLDYWSQVQITHWNTNISPLPLSLSTSIVMLMNCSLSTYLLSSLTDRSVNLSIRFHFLLQDSNGHTSTAQFPCNQWRIPNNKFHIK